MRAGFLAAALVCSSAALAHADESHEHDYASDQSISTRVSLRVGGASSDEVGRPVICVDVRVLAGFSLESCGTGSELLHNEQGRQLAHARVNYQLFETGIPGGRLRFRAGLGIAELQVGDDQPGLSFGSPDERSRASVAGPEAAAQAMYVMPMSNRFEAIASATVGLAWFEHAAELIERQNRAQPFVSIEVGVGW